MKILCVLFTTTRDNLEAEAKQALEDHEVTIIHSYEDAITQINDVSRGVPPFDVILADIIIHRRLTVKEPPMPYGPLLTMHASRHLVGGVGVFVPASFKNAPVFDCPGGILLVVSRECWTSEGKRDYKKLLDLVNSEIKKFNASH